MASSGQRWQFLFSFSAISLLFLAIGILSAAYVNDAKTDKEKGDRRLVAAVFILVSIIVMFYIYTVLLRDSMLKVRKAVKETAF